jgi:tRNA(Ile)-lysidine synthase
MKDSLLKIVRDFLATHLKPEGPLLLGLSGGEDSSALFSLLLECRSLFSFDLHVAHFDHAWREESVQEAAQLQGFVSKYGFTFHTERAFSSPKDSSNLEEKARELRFDFFQKVYQKIGAQALVLAHQREDQVETILKRLFEGSGILALGGMRTSSYYEGMLVWRPLLSVPREEIEKWNQGKEWAPFKDRTNLDLKFLRPRMREQLFPFLEGYFGKKVRNSLFRVGEDLALLKDFLEERLSLYMEKSEEGTLGSSLCFKDLGISDPFEKQEVVRRFLFKNQTEASSDVLKKAVFLLDELRPDKKLDVSQGELLLDRGTLVFLKKELPKSFQGRIPLREGSFSSLDVVFSSNPARQRDGSLLSCFLKGEVTYRLDGVDSFCLTSYDLLAEKDQKTVSAYLAKNKVPAKMRKLFPFVTNNDRLVDCDFCFNLDLNCEDSFVFSNIILKK